MHGALLSVAYPLIASAAFPLARGCLFAECTQSGSFFAATCCLAFAALFTQQHTATLVVIIELHLVGAAAAQFFPTVTVGACVALQVSRCAASLCARFADQGGVMGEVVIQP